MPLPLWTLRLTFKNDRSQPSSRVTLFMTMLSSGDNWISVVAPEELTFGCIQC